MPCVGIAYSTMWRRLIQNPGRRSQRSATSLFVSKRAAPAQQRCLSSTVLLDAPSSHMESPFVINPLTQTMENPTAEKIVVRNLLDTLHIAVSSPASSDIWQGPWRMASSVIEDDEEKDLLPESETLPEHEACTESNTNPVENGINLSADDIIVHEIPETVTPASSVLDEEKEEEGLNSESEQAEDSEITSGENVNSVASGMKVPAEKVIVQGTPQAVTPQMAKNNSAATQRTLQGHLKRAIQSRDAELAMKYFQELRLQNVPVELPILEKLFFFMSLEHPLYAYKVLTRYAQLSHPDLPPLKMYERMSAALGRFPVRQTRNRAPKSQKVSELPKAFRGLQHDLAQLPVEPYQHACYPKLLVSMMQQPISNISTKAKFLYRFMRRNNYPLDGATRHWLLSLSQYARQDDLPFADLLAELAGEGHQIFPPVAINALQNLHPFTDLDATKKALQTILDLQNSLKPGDGRDYRVDRGTLEQITVAGARHGSFELNLLVWDLMDTLGYEPTLGMYENTIHSFAMGYRQDHSVFAVLGEMESKGFVPSRGLIQSIARSIRYSVGRVDSAYMILTKENIEGSLVSVASLNVILYACAELGEVDRAFATLDDFPLHNLEPNQDTYSFVLEALARNMDPGLYNDEEQRMADAPSRLDAADAVLAIMEGNNVPLCHHGIHQYARLLFNIGELDEAAKFILERKESGENISNKTFFILASEFGRRGNFDMARLLESKTTEPLHFLRERLDRFEKELSESLPSPKDP